MEYASGGNLTNHVTMGAWSCEERNGLFLAEDEARYFIWQSIQAVHFLHSNHVAHRDLKLDNIVLDGSKPPRIKVCDFGFAKSWNEEAHMKTQVGTPVYMCPQLIKCSDGIPYDASKADLWACGVLLCVMMLGLFPFDHVEHPDPNESAAKHEVLRYQVQCSWREHTRVAEAARKLSMECRDLLDKIFELDERRRISLADVMKHPWMLLPLPEKYNIALEKINVEQTKIEEMRRRMPVVDCTVRNAQIDKMSALSGKTHEEGDPVNLHCKFAHTLAELVIMERGESQILPGMNSPMAPASTSPMGGAGTSRMAPASTTVMAPASTTVMAAVG